MHLIILVKLINVLNDCFHSILTNEKLNSLLNLDPSLSCPNLNQIIVTSLGVQKLLESLNLNKASGPDDVPTYILRDSLITNTGNQASIVIRSGSVAK